MNKSTMENEINQGVNRAGDVVRDAAGRVSNAAHNAAEAVSNVRQSATEAVSNARQSASDAATYVRHKADDVTTAVGGALENTGHYLREDGINHMVSDLANLVRRNPVPALLVGIGAGYLIACAMSGRSSAAREFHA